MSRPVFVVTLLMITSLWGRAQVDSLESVLLTAQEDSTKSKIYLQLFSEYRYSDPLKAETSVLNAVDLASGIENQRYHVSALNTLANFLNRKAENDSAIAVYNQALLIAEENQFLQREDWMP